MPGSDPAGGSVSTTLVAPALPECLDDVHALVDTLWTACPAVGDTDRMRFESVVIEVVGNVIEHSVPVRTGHTVRLEVTLICSDTDLTGEFADDAAEVEAVRLPTAMPDDDESEHGRGLAIVRAMSDGLSYRRDGETNRWSVVCVRG